MWHITGGQMLQLPRARLEDTGQYVCTATNSAGLDQKSILLSVYGEHAQWPICTIQLQMITSRAQSRRQLRWWPNSKQIKLILWYPHQSRPRWSPGPALSQTWSPHKLAPLSPWDAKPTAFPPPMSHGTKTGCSWRPGTDWAWPITSSRSLVFRWGWNPSHCQKPEVQNEVLENLLLLL